MSSISKKPSQLPIIHVSEKALYYAEYAIHLGLFSTNLDQLLKGWFLQPVQYLIKSYLNITSFPSLKLPNAVEKDSSHLAH